MPADIGYQFAPGSDAQFPGGDGGGQSPHGLSPQSAVKLLQLRVPERQAASGLAPQGLLTGQGGQGYGGLQAIIQMLMRRAQGGAQAGAQGYGAQGGGMPSPHITPGSQGWPPGQLPDLKGPMDLANIDPAMRDRLLDFDLGGGRTLRGGGGFSGTMQGQPQPIDSQAPPLF